MPSIKSWSSAALEFIPKRRKTFIKRKVKERNWDGINIKNACEAFYVNEQVLELAINENDARARAASPIPFNPHDQYPRTQVEFAEMEKEYKKRSSSSARIAKKDLKLITPSSSSDWVSSAKSSPGMDTGTKPPASLLDDISPEELLKLMDAQDKRDDDWDELNDILFVRAINFWAFETYKREVTR